MVSGTEFLAFLEQRLRETLPSTWGVELRLEGTPERGKGRDAVVEIESPTGEVATISIELKARLDAQSAPRALAQARAIPAEAVILAAPFLSPRTREIITDLGAGFADATGNLRLQLDRPAVFIETPGAAANPWPERDEPLRTLKGPGAGRVVRTLCEVAPPYGVRELAQLSGVAASTVSRVLALLQREALVGRDEQSRVVVIDWQNLIRRWAQDYSLTKSNLVGSYIEPRGLAALLGKLDRLGVSYSATGSLAAAARAGLTAPRLGVVFVTDVARAAERLGLRATDVGVNVLLIEPYASVVFDRTWEKDGIRYAGMAQVAADLLTGPGRSLSEGEEVLRWMGDNEDAWRA